MLYYYAITGLTPAPLLTMSALVAVPTEEMVLDTHPPTQWYSAGLSGPTATTWQHTGGVGGGGECVECSDNMTMDYGEEG